MTSILIAEVWEHARMSARGGLEILLVEDEGIVRSGMKALVLIAEPTARVHEAASYDQAVAVLQSQPSIEIAFVDANLKGDKSGLDVVKYIRANGLNARALMLSSEDRKEFVTECLEAGASGYVPKGIEDNNIFPRALDTVLQGGTFLPFSVVGRGGDSPPPGSLGSALIPAQSLGLTPRELEVLYYLAQGDLYKTIADRMQIKEATVRKDYVTKLLKFFKVARRTHLMVELARRKISIPRPLSASTERH
jgi:two-component system nitrate/nitrite response regulator NarL